MLILAYKLYYGYQTYTVRVNLILVYFNHQTKLNAKSKDTLYCIGEILTFVILAHKTVTLKLHLKRMWQKEFGVIVEWSREWYQVCYSAVSVSLVLVSWASELIKMLSFGTTKYSTPSLSRVVPRQDNLITNCKQPTCADGIWS